MTESPKLTKSQAVAADITALLRARNSLLWIVTREEARAERYLLEACASAKYIARTWDCAAGARAMNGDALDIGSADISAMLGAIEEQSKSGDRQCWILRDLPAWLAGPIGMQTLRMVRNLARSLPSIPTENAQALIVLSPSGEIPPELAGHATVIEWPLPDREEIGAGLDAMLAAYGDKVEQLNGNRDAAIDAAIGLSGDEATACYARSLVQFKRIDVSTVSKEKRRVIARERVLEWYDPLPGGLDAVGGLENLKAWLTARRLAYTPKARAFGLPAPKGAMLVGVPGCGKSLTAKAIATAWQIPLLRVDLGGLKSKYVGESEANLRKVFDVVAAIGRCVVWFDEIEKALQGATSGSADGGVSSDALGSILSWMQERQGEAFVIATANDVTALPPELLRKGRFDELFFVDLPNPQERASVALAALKAHGRKPDVFRDSADVGALVTATEGFTGSEIAALVPDALFTAFADNGRQVECRDLLAAAKSVTPLAKTAADKIARLREWGKRNARAASLAVESDATTKSDARALDI